MVLGTSKVLAALLAVPARRADVQFEPVLGPVVKVVDAPEGWLVVDDLDDRTEDEFELDIRAPRGNCEQCGEDLACPQHHGLSLGQEGDA